MRLRLSFPELNTHSEAVIVSVESFPLTLLRKTLRGIKFRQLSRIFFSGVLATLGRNGEVLLFTRKQLTLPRPDLKDFWFCHQPRVRGRIRAHADAHVRVSFFLSVERRKGKRRAHFRGKEDDAEGILINCRTDNARGAELKGKRTRWAHRGRVKTPRTFTSRPASRLKEHTINLR